MWGIVVVFVLLLLWQHVLNKRAVEGNVALWKESRRAAPTECACGARPSLTHVCEYRDLLGVPPEFTTYTRGASGANPLLRTPDSQESVPMDLGKN
jgi:hypothetical protein